MSTTPKVYAAISAVQKQLSIEGISKDRRNQQQGFSFRGIDDIYNSLAGLLAANGLVILPRVLSRSCTERETKTGGALFVVVVEVEFDFVCAEDGSVHTVRTIGEASDSADKATNKAMSAAYKYAALQAFCIPTEGDNDADATTHEVAPRQQQTQRPPDDRPPSNTEMNEAMQRRRVRRGEAAIAIGSAQNCAKLDKIFSIAQEDLGAGRLGNVDMIELERLIVERYVDLSESEADLAEAERLIHEAGKRNVIRWETAQTLGNRIADKRAKLMDEAPL